MAPQKANSMTTEELVPQEIEDQQLPTSPNYIRLKVHGFENIVPIYPVAEITMKIELADVVLGESKKTHVSSNKFVPTDYELLIPCDFTTPDDMDKFISRPIIITVIETLKEVAVDVSMPDIKEKDEKDIRSKTSIGSRRRSRSTSKADKKGKDKKGKEKEKKVSKFKKAMDYVGTKPEQETVTGPQTVGLAMLDLLPFFLGTTEYSEELRVRQSKQYFNEKAIAAEDLPKLLVTVTLEGAHINLENSNVFHITAESIFNIPSLIAQNYCCQLSVLLPVKSNEYESIEFTNGTYTSNGDFIKYQFWPPVQDTIKPRLESTYRIDNDLSGIVNTSGINIDAATVSKQRIEYNTIKRMFLDEECKDRIFRHIRNFRKIAVEIYVTPKKEDQSTISLDKKKENKGTAKKGKNDKGKGSSTTAKSKATSTTVQEGPAEYLHLMAIANVDQLLYPGIKSCRVACPISTYHEQELLKLVGVKDSHYRPKPPEVSEEIIVKDKKGAKKKDKSAKKDSKGSKSSKKSDKGKKGKGKKDDQTTKSAGINLAEKLPPPPPPEPEPSTQVLNDKGEPSFLLIEFCFMKPLHAERVLEDLTDKLSAIIRMPPTLRKCVISSSAAQEIYNETIRSLIADMNDQYIHFIEEQKQCKCDNSLDFAMYLQQVGVYQTYLASATRALATLVPEKYQFETDIQGKFSKEFQSFIKHVHVDMIRQMNKVINELIVCNLRKTPHEHMVKNEELLLYAKEATEMHEYNLADRYYLERLCCNEKNANFWFDYAIYQMEIKNVDHAVHCLRDALSYDSSHKYCLLMYGLILFDKGKTAEAETCLLTLTLTHPRWPEGWGGLYFYYNEVNNIEGMELAMQMANKHINGTDVVPDYFSSTDDLAWSTQLCTENIYSKTAVLFIKLRLFEQSARIIQLIPEQGIREYLTGVLAYYNGNFQHALQHLENAKEALGLNYGLCSLIGHCFMKINNHCNAITLYEMIMPMFNRPDDIHLVYLFNAICYDVTGNWQKARMVVLLACKYSPTPQAWMHAGSFYFKQNDFLSAEQCLIQANLCDNRLPDPWAYLALINAHLGKEQETDLCLTQAKKFGPTNSQLVANVEKIISSMNI